MTRIQAPNRVRLAKPFHNANWIASTIELPLAGFVIAFVSPAQPSTGYIHFTGVHPDMRRTGLARDLYDLSAGCTRVKAITSPVNDLSIAFHRALGFTASEPIKDYDGPNLDRVEFQKQR